MNRSFLALLLLGALSGAPTAQQPATAETGKATSEAQKVLDDIVARLSKSQNDAYAAYEAAKDDAEREKAIARMSGVEFRPEFETFAAAHMADDLGAKALLWVLRLAEGDTALMQRTIDSLLEAYMEREVLSELPAQLRYAGYQMGTENVSKALREMVEHSPHAAVRGPAHFVLGCVLVSEAKTDAEKAAGRKNLEAALDPDYADLEWQNGTLGDAANGWLFELDNLQVGMVAPDFQATDENGVTWKLSDYRGKVVVVDFWGYW